MTEQRQRRPLLDLLRRIEETGGWDRIFDLMADGKTTREIAAQFGVDRTQMRRVIRQYADQKEVNEAITDGVDSMVEDALEDINNATPETAHMRQAQMTAKLKLAGFLNKEKFGETKGPAVQLNLSLADLHLAAVKQVNQERPPIDVAFRQIDPPATALPSPDPDADVQDLLR